MMIDAVREIDIGGNRVLRVGGYTLDSGDGEPPQLRVFLASGWTSEPPLPFHEQTVDIPAARVPELVAALEALPEGEDS